MGNTHVSPDLDAALEKFEAETEHIIEERRALAYGDKFEHDVELIKKERVGKKLLIVLKNKLEDTRLAAEILSLVKNPEFPEGTRGPYVPVYYVCPQEIKSDVFPVPLEFAQVAIGEAVAISTAGASTKKFYKNAALTFSKPLGSFTLYYYVVGSTTPPEYQEVSTVGQLIKIEEVWPGEGNVSAASSQPPGRGVSGRIECIMLVVQKDSPFSSDLTQADKKAFMKKKCVREDADNAVRDERIRNAKRIRDEQEKEEERQTSLNLAQAEQGSRKMYADFKKESKAKSEAKSESKAESKAESKERGGILGGAGGPSAVLSASSPRFTGKMQSPVAVARIITVTNTVTQERHAVALSADGPELYANVAKKFNISPHSFFTLLYAGNVLPWDTALDEDLLMQMSDATTIFLVPKRSRVYGA